MHPSRTFAVVLLVTLAAATLRASTFEQPLEVSRPARPQPIAAHFPLPDDMLEGQSARRGGYPYRGFSVAVMTPVYLLFPGIGIGGEFSAPLMRQLSLYGRVEGTYSTFFGGALFETGARYYWDRGPHSSWYGGAGLKFAAGDFFIDRVFEDTNDKHRSVGGFGLNTHGGFEFGARHWRFFVQSEHGFIWFFGSRVSTVLPFFGASAGIRFYF
ncbi:MAG: hypothetical protein IT462_11030 [Planctomycetes bacterium]|nr:hypothetical protein [Planctomycetota bacterium]